MAGARTVHPSWAGASPAVRLVVALVPAATVAAIGVLASGRAALFRDEVATALDVALSPGDLWQAATHVDHLTLPYLWLMKGWVALAGDSTVALRTPSIAAMAGTAALVAVLAGRLAGVVAGAVAGGALCVAPLTHYLAGFARPYAVATVFAVLALFALDVRLVRGSRPWWGVYAGLLTASLLVQPFAAFALPAHLGLALATPTRGRWRVVAGAWSLALVVEVLFLAPSWSQQGQVGWIKAASAVEVRELLLRVLSTPFAWAVGVALVAGPVLVATRRGAAWWWTGTGLVLGPPVALAVVSAVLHPSFVFRYLFLVPAGAAVLVGGLAGAVTDLAVGREPGQRTAGRSAVAVLLLSAGVLAAAVLPWRVDVRLAGQPVTDGRWSAEPRSQRADALAEVLRAGDLLVVEQRLGWSGYAAELARAWDDRAFSTALERRAVSGDLSDVTRSVIGVRPPRTGEAVPAGGGPVRVVLLSLRPTAVERYLDATTGAGCRYERRVRDRRLGDTRMWLLQCDTVPATTRLSEVGDAFDK